jgi:selenocysteine lyase/cysteine desulfurase
MVASAIDWKKGDRIVVPAPEYPSNVYPWMDAQKRFGAEVVFIPEVVDAAGVARVSEDAILEAASDPRTRLVALSHVQWASGQRMDIDRIGAFCRGRGILFAVDGIQSLGVVPTDVKTSNIDILTAGGHKWLLGPTGAGFLYVRRSLIASLAPPVVGWNSVEYPLDWRIKFNLRADAGRFETGTHAFPCLAGLKPSLELLLDVGIEQVHAQVKSLGDRFARGVATAGYRVVTDRAAGCGVGGAVCFEPKPGQEPEALVKQLRSEKKIEIAARMGRLRFSPHVYNTHEQVERVLVEIQAAK